MSGQISIFGSDKDIRVEWKLSHISKRSYPVKSPFFNIFNCECLLFIEPNEEKYMCMKFYKYLGPEICAKLAFGMKTVDGSKIGTEVIEIFLSNSYVSARLKLITMTEFLSSRDIMASDDCVTVFCILHLIEIIDSNVVNNINPSYDIQGEMNAGFLPSNTAVCEENGTATSGYTGVNEAISVLTENLKDLYLKKRHTDITIKVQDKEFLAHKTILVARSEVFASMFEHDTLEKRRGFVEIEDCNPESFEDFLLFLYTADLKIVSSENVVGLFKLSDKYGCKELLKECVQCMIREVSVDTFSDYLQLAILHNESDLLTAVTNFFIRNAKMIFPTAKWCTLLEEHPSLCNELLIKFANA